MELVLKELNEIDFWNAPLYSFWQDTKITSTNEDLLYLEYKQIITYLENVNTNVQKSAMDKNTFLHKYIEDFFRKIQHMPDLSSNKMVALKLLSKLSTFNNIGIKDAFKASGLVSWIRELEENNSFPLTLEVWKILNNITSTNNNYKYMDGVYPVFSPLQDQTPVADIVLVHGIMGGAGRTWRQHDSARYYSNFNQQDRKNMLNRSRDVDISDIINERYTWMWPYDWLSWHLNKPFRLIAVDYPALWWKWSKRDYYSEDDDKSLDQLSKEFLVKLKTAGVGNRPIIWITHSMGGLMVKQIFELENKILESSSDKVNLKQNLLLSTRGIIFLSVPHFGSPLASWSRRFSTMLRPSRYILDMQADSNDLISLHQSFLRICQKYPIKVLTLNESRPSEIIKNGPKFLFVPKKYGDPLVGEFYEVDATHLEVCKPINMFDQIYHLIENFISKIFKEL